MKLHSTTLHVLLAGIFLSGALQLSHAAPGPATPAAAPKAKPKLAPRPIPGMAASHDPAAGQAPAASQPVAAPVKKMAASNKSATPAVAASSSTQARILMIYRRGTVELPPVVSEPAASPEPQDLGLVRPASLATPRPGQVRIISKAEADVLAAQPKP